MNNEGNQSTKKNNESQTKANEIIKTTHQQLGPRRVDVIIFEL